MGTLAEAILELTSPEFDTTNLPQCVTTIFRPWLLTMALACARPALLETTRPGQCSPQLWEGPGTLGSWLEWDRKIPMLETRPNPRGGSSPLSTLLSMALSLTGMIWRRSGITHFTMSSGSLLRSTQFCSPKLLLTPRPTGRR